MYPLSGISAGFGLEMGFKRQVPLLVWRTAVNGGRFGADFSARLVKQRADWVAGRQLSKGDMGVCGHPVSLHVRVYA